MNSAGSGYWLSDSILTNYSDADLQRKSLPATTESLMERYTEVWVLHDTIMELTRRLVVVAERQLREEQSTKDKACTTHPTHTLPPRN